MAKLLGNKVFVVGGSLVVLLALGVVLGLTIVRIQSPQPTVTQPKAAGPAVTWPSCVNAQGKPASCKPSDFKGIDPGTGEEITVSPPGGYYWCTDNDCFNTSNDKKNINKCCSKVKSDPFACDWPARGWCTPAQCPGSGGQRCGLYIYNSCSNCYGLGNYNGSCSWQYDCVTGQNCVNGTCVTTNNSCWVNVPIPKNGVPQGNSESTTPTFSWRYDTTYSGDVRGVAAYLFSCPARNDSCLVGAAYGSGSGFTSADLSKFGKTSLSPNTTYYWGVTVNSYSPPSAQYDCMPKWQFTTGAGATGPCGGQTCGTNQVCINNTCVNQSDAHLSCGQGNICTWFPGAGSNTDGCTVKDQGCTISTTAGECEVCGGGNTKSCSTGLKCSGDASKVGVCIKNDGTTSCGSCTSDNDCLLKALVCAEGSCVDPAGQHLACDSATRACVRKKGSGSNLGGCTAVGGTCLVGCSVNSDCPTGQVCQNNVCVTQSSQVNACWGNGGTDGKCYDCNGDGEVNILDFSCFRNKYLQNVQ